MKGFAITFRLANLPQACALLFGVYPHIEDRSDIEDWTHVPHHVKTARSPEELAARMEEWHTTFSLGNVGGGCGVSPRPHRCDSWSPHANRARHGRASTADLKSTMTQEQHPDSQSTPFSGPDSKRSWIALVFLCLGQFMFTGDDTVVNVALPSIERSLGFDQAGIVWVSTCTPSVWGLARDVHCRGHCHC